MKISFIGLGKLGLPTAMTMAYKGHKVLGYDINEKRYTYVLDTKEGGLNGNGNYTELFDNKNIKTNLSFISNLEECVMFGDIVFVAIQTPHKIEYEGVLPLTEKREDFNYEYLVKCVSDISKILEEKKVNKVVSIISTVLPGTIRRDVMPVMSSYIKLCYNPYFIAMGTVVRDFLFPEFILLGCVDNDATNKVIEFYKTITDSEVYNTTLENAEMIKVSYNTFIGTKIALANNIMELCDNLPGTDCDGVMNGLFKATNRLISTNYLRGGMGDGGGCLPPGELVMTSNGMEPIETIKVGDMVLSHNGILRKVVKVYERDYEGDLVEVSVIGQPSIKVTTDHPMLVCDEHGKNVKEKEASKLIVGNDYIPSYKINGKPNIRDIPEYLTKEYCVLAGTYIADKYLGRNINKNYENDKENLVNDFGDGITDFKFPDWVLYGPSWIMGTICYNITKYYDVASIVVADKHLNLIYGLQHILNNFGIDSVIAETNHLSSIHYFNKNDLVALLENPREISETKCYKLQNINKIPYSGKVHNIWVDTDHTYVTKIGAVHNCHPRDNIALSWLSNELDISYNFYDAIMTCREKQTYYLARLIKKYKLEYDKFPVYLLGKAFKENTNISTGSPAILLKNLCDKENIKVDYHFDPLIDIDNDKGLDMKTGIYCLATKHSEFAEYKFPNGSIIIDPFRYIKKDINPNCIIHSVGIGTKL